MPHPPRLALLAPLALALLLAGSFAGFLAFDSDDGAPNVGASHGSRLPAQSASAGSVVAEPVTSAPSQAGIVHFEKDAKSSFDSEDTEANAAWIGGHFARMLTYSPYFDSRTSWYPNAWAYSDCYAIYVGGTLASEHPEWILKDAHGSQLYIPYGSPPSQYAADISNPAFRQYWIANEKATLAKGYKGVFIDDVSMWANTGNASGEVTTPISGVSHQPISDAKWREYMVTFMREVRAALPTYEIVHNATWYADGGSANRGTTSPLVRQQIEAANLIEVERGVNDSGLTGGEGIWSVSNLLTYIDEVHALGKGVVLSGEATGVPAMRYNLVAYFLISGGSDYVSGGQSTQDVKHFWRGWSTNLGAALGARYKWNGLWRRDFERGSVYLNPPGGATVTVGHKPVAPANGLIVTN